MTHRLPRLLPTLPGLLAAVSPLAAQAPGYQQIDTRQIMAEYHAEVLSQVNALMTRWGDAWDADKADDVADLYWENAVLILPGAAPYRGRDAIRGYLNDALPRQAGRVEAFMLDFDASGGMAVVYGNYLFTENGQERAGPLVTVYLRRGRTWKIRSQVFTEGGSSRLSSPGDSPAPPG